MREVKLVKFDDDEDEDNPRPGIQEIVVLDGLMKDPTIVTKEAAQASDLTPQTSLLECRGIMIHLVMVVVQMIV